MKNRMLLTFGLALLALPLSMPAAAEAPATYDLALEAPDLAGQATRIVETRKMTIKFTMLKDGKQLVSQTDTTDESFEATRTVLAVSGTDSISEKLAFSKATHLVDGKKASYPFEGKTVLVKYDPATGTTYACEDGTALSPEDSKALAEFRKPNEVEAESKDSNPLIPKTPVAVGESWSPDVIAVGMEMLQLSSSSAIDAAKSSSKITLAKVKAKNGVPMAQVKGNVSIFAYELGEMKLEKPIATKIGIFLELAADGSIHDGKADMKMQMKGKSPIDLGGGEKGTVILDMNAAFSSAVTSVPAA